MWPTIVGDDLFGPAVAAYAPHAGDMVLAPSGVIWVYFSHTGWVIATEPPPADERRQLGDERARRQTEALDWDRMRAAAYRDCTERPDPTAVLD